jgi:hypothetical protein
VYTTAYIDAPATPPVSDLICGQLEENNTFIICDALKSDSFTVTSHAQETADAVTEIHMIKNILKDESKINMTQVSDTTLSFKGPGYQTFAIRIYPFWIKTDKTEKKQFFFKAKPPSIWEKITGKNGIAKSPTRDIRFSPQDSVILPTGSFYKFD